LSGEKPIPHRSVERLFEHSFAAPFYPAEERRAGGLKPQQVVAAVVGRAEDHVGAAGAGGRARWRSGEIVDVLREAGEPVPTNITDALNQKARKDLFAVKDRMWSLTGEGKGWVKYSLLRQTDAQDDLD